MSCNGGMSRLDRWAKRAFDLLLSITGLLFTWWLILLAWLFATMDTKQNGVFIQRRVGRGGRLFSLFKIRTMRRVQGVSTTVTAEGDVRITRLGRLLRKSKIDELPQLLNVLRGDMSFVGPRPDVPGYADLLEGDDRIILTVRPGITGPATLKYRDEERLLAMQRDPQAYNDEVIFPDKVRINREYVENYSFADDLKYIWKTLRGD